MNKPSVLTFDLRRGLFTYILGVVVFLLLTTLMILSKNYLIVGIWFLLVIVYFLMKKKQVIIYNDKIQIDYWFGIKKSKNIRYNTLSSATVVLLPTNGIHVKLNYKSKKRPLLIYSNDLAKIATLFKFLESKDIRIINSGPLEICRNALIKKENLFDT